MKNLFRVALLAACLGAAPAVKAAEPGDGEYPPAIVARALTLTRALDRRIHFNEGQFIAVKRLHLQMLTERQALELQYAGGDTAERDAQLAEAQLRYEANLNRLLQPRQVVAYFDLRNNLTAHRIK